MKSWISVIFAWSMILAISFSWNAADPMSIWASRRSGTGTVTVLLLDSSWCFSSSLRLEPDGFLGTTFSKILRSSWTLIDWDFIKGFTGSRMGSVWMFIYVILALTGIRRLSKHLLSGLMAISGTSMRTVVSSLMIGWCLEFSIPFKGLKTLSTSFYSWSSYMGCIEGSWCFW